MKSERPTIDALRVLHHRYVGDDSARRQELEHERVHAKVARQVFELRTRAGLSQEDLARRVGTTESAISRLENADYEDHSVAVLRRVADALEAQLDIDLRPTSEATTALDRFAEVDAFNFNQTRQALERLHPGSLETIQLTFDLLHCLAQEFADNCGEADASARLNQWLEKTGGPAKDLVRFLDEARLIGEPSEHDPTTAGREALASGRRAIATLWLLQRMARDFLFGLGDLMRLRVTPAIGYLRIQSESVGLAALFSENPPLAGEWMNTVQGGSKEFYNRTQSRLKKALARLDIVSYYELGSEQSLHSRPHGIAGGIANAPDEGPNTSTLSYQEFGGDARQLFAFVFYFLQAHANFAKALLATLNEVVADGPSADAIRALSTKLAGWQETGRKLHPRPPER